MSHPERLLFDGPAIPDEWIDHNGHMNLARYGDVFYLAIRQLSNRMGLTREYKDRTKTASFAAKMNITYRRELRHGDEIGFEARIAGYDNKRVHGWIGILRGREEELVASCEMLSLNIDTTTRRVADMAPEILKTLADLHTQHLLLPEIEGLGAGIQLSTST